MSLSKQQTDSIKNIIRKCLRKKFESYSPETKAKPFHTRLLGEKGMALFSFIHSLNTTFGTSIYEPVAILLAESKFKAVETQIKSGTKISAGAYSAIQKIMDELTTKKRSPDKESEISRIRDVCRQGEVTDVKKILVDLRLENNEGEIYFFDIKTAKPNTADFIGYKRMLLEWSAAFLFEDPQAKINTLIAIPYNPYEPKPYSRWTKGTVLDVEKELMIAEGFWDFLGGEGGYEDLLGCFECVGIEMREEIDTHFAKFKTT